MKYKAYLCSFLLTFPILGKASAEADSLRQVQISRLQEQVNWVNPEAIRAYLDDTKSSLGDKAPVLYQKLEELETLLPQVNRHLSEDTTRHLCRPGQGGSRSRKTARPQTGNHTG